jgi:hypothetical protein
MPVSAEANMRWKWFWSMILIQMVYGFGTPFRSTGRKQIESFPVISDGLFSLDLLPFSPKRSREQYASEQSAN